MQEEILRTINKCEEMGWITINPKIRKEALASMFLHIIQEMSLKKFTEIFNIFN